MNPLRAGTGLIHTGPAIWHRIDGRRHRHHAHTLLPAVLRAAAVQLDSPEPPHWVIHSTVISSTRVAVIKLGPPGQEPVAVVKMPGTPSGAASQQREAAALTALAAAIPPDAFERLLPSRLATGTVAGQPFTVERALPGVVANSTSPDPAAHHCASTAAATAIGQLHRHTSHTIVVDAAVLRSWVDDRLAVAATATRDTAALHRLGNRLRDSWAGREVSVGWVHGDFWLGNVLVDPTSGATTGIVDWEWAGPEELPAQDLIYACVHRRMQTQHRELGDVVATLLGRAEWDTHEQAIQHAAGLPDTHRTSVDTDLLLLVWLRQIAYNLIQDPALARHIIWTRHNIENVLHAI